MTTILTFQSIADFRTQSITGTPDLIYIVSYLPPSTTITKPYPRGGGFLQPAVSGPDDSILAFKNNASDSFWTRLLEGGMVDAYMAGATGSGVMGANGVVDITTGADGDDAIAIGYLIAALRKNASNSTNSVKLSVRIGDGIFRVGSTIDLTSFPFGSRGWEIDGTGATLLGTCTGTPVVDMTDSRFATVRNLQIIGSAPNGGAVDHVPSCGIRIGRKADNEAANQMTMDHVGIRGSFQLAAFLNVASEQFSDLGCEFANEFKGAVYGYAGDAFNFLQWTRPAAFSKIDRNGDGTYTVTGVIVADLSMNDVLVARSDANDGVFLTTVLTVQSVNISAGTFVVASFSTIGSFQSGKYYKRLFGGAIDTPGLTPFAQNSFKQQLHQQGNYRAPYGVAGIFEGCDSQHIYRSSTRSAASIR